MINVRSIFSVCVTVVFAAVVALPAAGCGSGGGEASAQVSPDFQKKTSNMLEQKAKDQLAKYKTKKTPNRR
jgi:hypothetical protein